MLAAVEEHPGGPVTGLPAGSGVVASAVARVTTEDYERWARQVERTGHCERPIRLAGRVDAVDLATGEMRETFSTAHEPDRVLLTACNNRRASVCQPCSERYRYDTYHLVAAGLRGGRGIPATVAAHPRVLVTLTAPSFGPVHGVHEGNERQAGGLPQAKRAAVPV